MLAAEREFRNQQEPPEPETVTAALHGLFDSEHSDAGTQGSSRA